MQEELRQLWRGRTSFSDFKDNRVLWQKVRELYDRLNVKFEAEAQTKRFAPPPQTASEKFQREVDEFRHMSDRYKARMSKLSKFEREHLLDFLQSQTTDQAYEKYYDKAASLFFGTITSPHVYAEEVRSLLRELNLRGNERIISLGAGTGQVETFLGKRVPRGKVVGFDFAAGMVAKAREVVQQEKVSNVSFYKEDAKNLEKVQDEFFDHAIALDVLPYVDKEHQREIFKEASKKIRRSPNNKFVFTYLPDVKEYLGGELRSWEPSLHEMKSMLGEAGLKVDAYRLLVFRDPITKKIVANRLVVVTSRK